MTLINRLAAYGLGAALILAPFAVGAQSALSSDPGDVQAGAYRLDPAHSKITWAVSHLGFSTYIGQFGTVEGDLTLDPKNLEKAKLSVTVDANSVGTLNPQLDAHLKNADFLDTARFPTASFRATDVERTGERTADITGDLTLHGVTRPVVVHAVFNQGGVNPLDKTYSLGFDGKAVLKRSDFGISTYLPAVGDEITLTIEAELKKVG